MRTILKRSSRCSLLIGSGLLAILVAACQSPSGAVFTEGDPVSEDRARELTQNYVDHHAAEFADIGGVSTKRVHIDRFGKAHAWLTQSVNGVPVFGGEGILHFNASGNFENMTDDFFRKSKVDTTPSISMDDAIEVAVASQGGWATVTGTPSADLQILVHEGRSYLTYRVQIDQFEANFDPAKPVVFVDAKTSDEVMEYDNLHHEFNSPNDESEPRTHLTYDMQNQRDEGYDTAPLASSGDSVAETAHNNAEVSLAYLTANHNRNSFDDKGATVLTYVHYGTDYVNAYWDGRRLTFGDGDRRNAFPLVSLDIVAHELAHGVMEHTAGLIYRNESGALNEANSDILAAATEAYVHNYPDSGSTTAAYGDTWMLGEDVWKKDPNRKDERPAALRYMDDPALAGDRDFYADRYVGSEDAGGVHSNSGIANLWFHLLANGGSHPRGKTTNEVPGIGVEVAADIWYYAITTQLTTSSDYADARVATVAAARAIGDDIDVATGTEYVTAVNEAWDAVGVTHAPLVWEGQPIQDALPVGELIDGVSVLGVGVETIVKISLPDPIYTALRFVLTGDTSTNGDADMYVAANRTPTVSSIDSDCSSLGFTSEEQCEVRIPVTGDYNVLIQAFNSETGSSGDVVGASLSVYGVRATTEFSCDDGFDNDGDKATDCADADCDGHVACGGDAGPGECTPDGTNLPSGCICEINSQCYFGNCKGKPGNKTCN